LNRGKEAFGRLCARRLFYFAEKINSNWVGEIESWKPSLGIGLLRKERTPEGLNCHDGVILGAIRSLINFQHDWDGEMSNLRFRGKAGKTGSDKISYSRDPV